MGYSIAAPIKSYKAKNEMLGFLNRNFNNLGDIYIRGPLDGRFLSYNDKKCAIGFDGTTISDYMIGVCAWIALKVGRVYVFPTKEKPKAAGPCKVLRYDGVETWPLLVTQRYRKPHNGYVQVNWVGALVPKPQYRRGLFRFLVDHKYEEAVYEELKRLDSLWNKRNK